MYKGEVFNSVTHLIGAVAALAGLVVLVILASLQADPWKIVSVSLYGYSLFQLYLVSTLYHGLTEGTAKRVFNKLDHAAIYVLIAGTYTPFALVTLRDTWGWWLFAVIWGLALMGLLIDMRPQRGKRYIPMIIYLLMGWLMVVAIMPLYRQIGAGGASLLLAGGVFYTSGLYFYARASAHNAAHGLWHLFVLAGSISHYFAILYYVL
ncbi:MAG: hemolysin III family protein [Gammaproteobacteria bacterium]|nr:hemolysin III family protein [Gammaproteobacteria bacterium]